jgi:carboxyl-terminal processing protease
MKIRPSRAIFCLVLILMISAVLGGVFGGQVRATTKGEEDADAAVKHFTAILGLVEENYANDVDSDKAVYGAIDGMLRTLDPHSKFFDPKAFNSLREDQRGKYYGLGITVTTRFGKVTVVSRREGWLARWRCDQSSEWRVDGWDGSERSRIQAEGASRYIRQNQSYPARGR